MKFVANLRAETIEAFSGHEASPAAYLLSSHRISRAALEAAGQVRAEGVALFADNGTKPIIDATIGAFRDDATALRLEVRQLRKTLGHVPRGRDVPAALRRQARQLADTVVRQATEASEAIDPEALLTAQLSMQPTDLIAQEDFATACLIALNLERETTGWPIARIDTLNRRSLRLWRRIADDPRCAAIRVHAVLSAMDYNTARSAGRLAARAGVRHAAIGIAGIALDPSAIDFFVVRTASFGLEKAAPRRYVRLAQVLRGIADGFAEASRGINSFHCLGLGSPNLLPVPAAAFDDTTVVTTDATSPIHDAVRDRVLYDPEHSGDRADTREIVVRIVGGGEWPFVSPFTQAFRDRFGNDPQAARDWFMTERQPAIVRAHLRTPSALTMALPLFCDADPVITGIASRSRIAHNHWVLDRIASGFADRPGRRETARAAIVEIVQSKNTATTRGLAASLEVFDRAQEKSASPFGRQRD